MGLVEIVFLVCFSTILCQEDTLNITSINDTATDQDEYLLKQKQEYFLELTQELKEQTLRITSVPNGVLSGYITHPNGTIEGTGVAFDIIKILQHKYGFNYTVVIPEDPVFKLNSESSKKGVLQILQEDKVDVVAAFLPMLYPEHVRYSKNLDTEKWVVLMRRPDESATGSGLLAPFTEAVWALIIISLVVVGPIMYLIIFLQAKLCRDDKNTVFTLPACMWFVYGALLKQGSTLNPTTDSSRLLFSTWWIFITVLTAFYTANLTAFLTLSKFTLPIKEPSDIKSKRYSWMTNAGNGIEDHLDTATIIGHPLKKDKISDSVILNTYVAKQNVMYIRERIILENIMYDDYKEKTRQGIAEESRCTFVITEFAVVTLDRAFAYSKKFKYQELFDFTIQHLIESGIIEFKQRESLPDTKICPLNLGNKERKLRNSDLIMTYMIVGGGLVISTIVFIIELSIRYYKTKKAGRRIPERNNNNNTFKNFKGTSSSFASPPPPYNSLFVTPFNYYKHNQHMNSEYPKRVVNGTEYWIVNSKKGTTELIPYRTPSALLYHFTH